MSEGSVLWTQNLGDAVSGDIEIYVRDSLLVEGRSQDKIIRTAIFADALGGKGGNVTLNGKRVTVSGGANIGTYSYGEYQAGNISVNASELVEVNNSATNPFTQTAIGANTFGKGNAGDNTISTRQLIITGAGTIASTTLGKGNAGNVNIRADYIEVSGVNIDNNRNSSITATTITQGTAGNLKIDTNSIIVKDGGAVSAPTLSTGNGGNITINASEFIEVSGAGFGKLFPSVISTSSNVTDEITRQLFNLPQLPSGNPGSIIINTPILRVFNDGLINVKNVAARTNSGRIEVNANSIVLNNEGGITAATVSGSGGNIQLNTNKLQINNGIINASTSGIGNGGDININATESVEVNGGGFEKLQQNIIIPAFEGNENSLTLDNFDNGIVTASQGEGDSGNIFIQTPNFKASNGGLIATTTLNQGAGGNITVNTDNILEIDNSLLGTGTFTEKASGNINLSASKFIAIGGAQVLTTTFDAGKAGNLNVSVSDSIDLIDPSEQGFTSGLFATSFENATGDGGNINVKTGDFNIVDRAAVSVSGEGVGNAGDIDIEALRLFLDNSSITAQSVAGIGGNINLSITDLLLLRNNSTISTRAGTVNSGGGDGGNITIDGGLIVAVPSENSDINANAFQGNGGNILINTPGIFGIQFRGQTTPQSDITASSEFGIDGNFDLNLLELDITSGLIELPQNLTDAADRISAGCPTDEEASFITSGRGGIPQNPRQVLPNEIVLQDLRTSPISLPLRVRHFAQRREPPHTSGLTPSLSPSLTPSPPSQIKEATGGIVKKNGVIEFIADKNQVQDISNNCS
ncbi:MAG: S-layer family protein [Cyanobacteria bacterium J06629_18]